jgi:hypothetical protein
MRKGGVKRKRKRNLFLAGLGEGFWPTPGASARAGALSAQRRPKSEGETARVREGRRRRRGPHVPEREGEENGVRLTRGGGENEPAVRGEDPAAGGLGGGSPPVARFSTYGRCPSTGRGWRFQW